MQEENKDKEIAKLRVQLAAYSKIIEKYADQINSFEVKSVPELKTLINPADSAVKKIHLNLLAEFTKKVGRNYDVGQDLPRLAIAGFHFISALEVIRAELPVSIWFTPGQVLEIGAADSFDRAIFLCSLLSAIGCQDSKIHVLEVEGGLRHPVIITKLGETFYLFDAMPPSQFHKAPTQPELLTNFAISGKKYTRSLFEFSSTAYEEFE